MRNHIKENTGDMTSRSGRTSDIPGATLLNIYVNLLKKLGD